ncbi:MAG TPA: SAM-dependent chlorinase/fluorinase [Pyrinomonadaceae bacterium]|nr:SAM-dependent chlorinase/fluorinase [Pyrinomonadaceae bacterium]
MTIVTLLTDFGTTDYFVGAVKGAILSVNPNAVIVDITHEIPAQDIEAGAFMLLASYTTFPAGTIHVAVVDPGVGSNRRPIIVSANGQLFVGPDNGIFSYICDREQTFHVTSEQYFRPHPSSTFHGRDIFAPVAAALSLGVAPEQFGPLIDDAVRLPSLETPLRIIHIDHFGNCVTNITRETYTGKSLTINGKTISGLRKFYGEANPGELFAIWGSAGFLEISVNGGSAAQILGATRGDTVS